jgi:diphthine synthase
MLSFIGVGLYGYDVTIEALEEARKCDKLYGEFYTSKLSISIEELEKIIGKKINILERKSVEEGNEIIDDAKKMHVGFITAGDPMAATTHIDLRIRAIEEGIETRVFNGISIVTAAASLLGLQIYKFGKIVSLPRPYGEYFPLSPYDAIKENFLMNLHTLILLDIDEEPMTANEAMELLLKMEGKRKEGVIKDDMLIAVVSITHDKKIAKAGYLKDMLHGEYGRALHSLVIPGKLHFMEAKALVKIADAPEEILK